ncbi:MAG: hypothetical protein LBR61_08300 [Synergistaceae bacterium]|jgi:glucose-1-phosphate adenylyltransferase|nr:hypothetical protein [Synergistaceae bacterium]
MKGECVAMLLAEGQKRGSGALAAFLPKSMIFYGGSHRLIDFALSACNRSGLDVVGVLSQGPSPELLCHIGNGRAWVSSGEGGVFMLPSDVQGRDYTGSVDAVRRNFSFIERFTPEHVCILPGDQIFTTDCAKMLTAHKKSGAAVTLAVAAAPKNTTLRFCPVRRHESQEYLVSTGIYIFRREALQRYLMGDEEEKSAWLDFERDVLPAMFRGGEKMQLWRFEGYRKEVDTAEDLWESGMDLLNDPLLFALAAKTGGLLRSNGVPAPGYVRETPHVSRSILSGLQVIQGRVEHSILSDSVVVERGAEVVDSILMPNVYVGKNAKIHRAILAPNARVMENVEIGAEKERRDFSDECARPRGISLIAPWVYIPAGTKLQKGSYIERERIVG